jgi:hypothetical protein
MDYRSPKHVELLKVMNKILCILLDYIYTTHVYFSLAVIGGNTESACSSKYSLGHG